MPGTTATHCVSPPGNPATLEEFVTSAEPDAGDPAMSRGDQSAETPDSTVHPARFVPKSGFTRVF